MSITKEKKQELIGQFGKNAEDSGTPESQIAILTERINTITDHVKVNKKDHSGRRGLIQLVSKRRKLLDYLKKRNPNGYVELIKKLNIRK
ncbi:MAG: 30S ribosomal protein S15 [Candidatus Marinimicrobia bacterium]|nr:30S ribosomal protein S15 [Candidatus Neomarinimicrobiota bacterium]MBL7023498.1 30S ribosomal protein S15 [Candidatus Neomarinimicrobiota bacterium]MBL7109543.1 30S ribosomal protein S15 [Candidatus Neomarinimicrobiota bacterium]